MSKEGERIIGSHGETVRLLRNACSVIPCCSLARRRPTISLEHEGFLAGDPDHQLRAWAKLQPAWPGNAQVPTVGSRPSC